MPLPIGLLGHIGVAFNYLATEADDKPTTYLRIVAAQHPFECHVVQITGLEPACISNRA